MKILGIFEDRLCILLQSPRIIIQPILSKNELMDLNDYCDLPVFISIDEVNTAAYGN